MFGNNIGWSKTVPGTTDTFDFVIVNHEMIMPDMNCSALLIHNSKWMFTTAPRNTIKTDVNNKNWLCVISLFNASYSVTTWQQIQGLSAIPVLYLAKILEMYNLFSATSARNGLIGNV